MSEVLRRDEARERAPRSGPRLVRIVRIVRPRVWAWAVTVVLLLAFPFYLDRFWLEAGLFAMAPGSKVSKGGGGQPNKRTAGFQEGQP